MPELKVFRWSAIAAGVVGVLTYIICAGTTLATGAYIGGMSWPYFSETGREGATYFIFAIGLTSTAIGLGLTAVTFYLVLSDDGLAQAPRSLAYALLGCPCGGSAKERVANAAFKVCILSLPFMALLGWASTIVYPTVHDAGAYAFFVLQTIALALWTAANNMRSPSDRTKSDEASDGAASNQQRVRLARNVVAAVFLVNFILYLPVGLAVNCEWERLPMDKCIKEERLGEEYCKDRTLDSDVSKTKLWDYSDCLDTNNMRSITQFFTIVSILLFYCTVPFDSRWLAAVRSAPVGTTTTVPV